MTITRPARGVARLAYRHAMMTGQFVFRMGDWAACVHDDEVHVVKGEYDCWVPIAKSWLV